MFKFFVDINLSALFLVLITVYLMCKDRSANRKVRVKFYWVMAGTFILVVSNVKLSGNPVLGIWGSAWFYRACKICLIPLIMTVLIDIVTHSKFPKTTYALFILAIVNIGVCIASHWTGWYYIVDNGEWIDGTHTYIPYAIDMFYLFVLVFLTELNHRDANEREHVVIILTTIIGIAAGGIEYHYGYRHLMDSCLAIGICVYYYYAIAQTYKRDALTGLLNRHDMNFDLMEIQDKEYYLSIIDIDNFKMINDKYGHQAGDEALKKVVRTASRHLLRKSTMYRYGGDEFAVISKQSTLEAVEGMFTKINNDLEKENFRISYGIALHEKDADVEECIAKADNYMYENKRLIKSENIWDDMTGLFNLRGFVDELDLLKKEAIGRGAKICLLALDVESLGSINKAYGYSEGNMIISTIAGLVKSALGPKEFAGHLGSDEFVVAFMVPYDETEYQKQYVDKILMSVDNCPNFDGKEYTIEVNTEVYTIDLERETSMEKAINNALVKKEENKEGRRKALSVNFDEKEFDKEEEEMVINILNENKLTYHYQPIISAKDGEIVAYEALMRTTTDPQLSPMTVLRYAENNRRFYQIEKLTFNNVLEQISKDGFIPDRRKVFINSIPGHILDESDYKELRARFGDILKNITIELTEQSELDDQSLEIVKRRQEDDSYKIAIDDFGSGNSNTYSLLRIKPDYIKLDRLLVADIDHNTKKQYFVNSIITFARENGMKVLAEGVETEAELKMMIRLQVDLIQGFFIGRPEAVPIRRIDEDVRKMIVSENIRGVIEGKRKIFIASNGWEVSLVQLALQEYTGITVSTSKIAIVGNSDYIADMTIKIKDGMETRIFLRDVRLNSVDDLPCIDIGEGSDVTLIVEGECSLNYKGIRVPESSKLTVMGTGNMSIATTGHDCYGIGCGVKDTVGQIILNQSGKISIRADGEYCTAVGGGNYRGNGGITVKSGMLDINVAGVHAVGIGCFYGNIPIKLADFFGNIEFRVNSGSVIGSRNGTQNIELDNFSLAVVGSGSKVAGIGNSDRSGGYITMDKGALDVHLTGQEVIVVGAKSGTLNISLQNVKVNLRGEGNQALGIGTLENDADVQIKECTAEIAVNAAQACAIGAGKDTYFVSGVKPTLKINE